MVAGHASRFACWQHASVLLYDENNPFEEVLSEGQQRAGPPRPVS